MIIKSHIIAGYRTTAIYLKTKGDNEVSRIIELSDPDASNLDDAFFNMWAIAAGSKVQKPLHHISINPFADERLTYDQVSFIRERCEQKYGYKPHDHQYVIVEHIKKNRQHFHIVWNRVSLTSGIAVSPGKHWLMSKKAAKEIESELSLKRTISRRFKRALHLAASHGRKVRVFYRYSLLKKVSETASHNDREAEILDFNPIPQAWVEFTPDYSDP